MKQSVYFLIFTMLMMQTGCAGTPDNTAGGVSAKANVLYRGGACGNLLSNPGATWIDTPERYHAVYEQIGRQTLGGTDQNPPEVDFEDSGVLLIKMGNKPTGGYGLDVMENAVQIKGETAQVAVEWVAPPAGAVLPQVVTCPFILIRLPKTGYGLIEVLDQHGETRAMIDIRS
jgi:PrcB C-terminal